MILSSVKPDKALRGAAFTPLQLTMNPVRAGFFQRLTTSNVEAD